MLRVVVAAPPQVEAPEDLERLPAAADLVELRLDLLGLTSPEADLAAWIAAAPRPVLATLRSAAEGGAFAGSPEEAARVLGAAAAAGAAWIDVEDGVEAHLSRLAPRARLVRSAHLARWAAPVRARGDAVVKVAGPLAGPEDLAAYRAALETDPPAGGRAFMPTGPLAALRALDPRAALLYGSAGRPVVAGQPALLDLLDELRAGEVTPAARLVGLLGEPPSHSPSPALHNAAFRHHGLDALHVPLPGLALEDALALPFAGYSVTRPFKQAALAAAAEADDAARACGAANTLVRRPAGRWRALNTDVGAVQARVPAAASGDRAVVHGAGGYARAALVALRRRGYAVGLVARDEARGRALAASLGADWQGSGYVRARADRVLVNATPAGGDGGRVVALDVELAGLTVLDAPYAEPGGATWLAQAALGRGASLVDGLALLVAQAEAQAEAFCGRPVPREVLTLALRPAGSLVLLGLRGAGKTTVGCAVARRLGRPFVDLDDEVLRATGRAPAEWIERQGLEAFRVQEAAALRALRGRAGLVVATGGGVVERREHVPLLRALGYVVWLDVAPEVAAARVAADPRPRPPLAGAADPAEEARRLFASRRGGYAAAAQFVLPAEAPVEEVAEALARRWLSFARVDDRWKRG